MTTEETYRQYAIEEYVVTSEPFYRPVKDEIELFNAAYAEKIPVLLKGPTGCGKTRFVEYMAYKLGRPVSVTREAKGNGAGTSETGRPLVTVACHEDLTASDLVGRYLLEGDSTRWIDGPLTRAVKAGALCYLDEIVEARKDTTVLIHPLTDHRRLLPIEKLGQIVEAREGFLLVISYNPGYQSALKDLKHSTRQRFMSIEFGYPPRDLEATIIGHESGVNEAVSMDLAKLGEKVRHLKEHGLAEGVSTRLLIYAGKLIHQGIEPRRACQVAVIWALTDDRDVQRSIEEVVSSIFE
jgi:nitric oxide reductase NorQ protein